MKAQNDKQIDKRVSSFLSAVDRGATAPNRQFLDKLQEQSSAEFLASSADRILQPEKTRTISLWRTIIKSRITRFAAAAAIIGIVTIGVIFFERSTTPAYAIEQTIEANLTIRYLHFKYFGPSGGAMSKEAWVEYDESGKISNLRVNFYKWGGDDIVQVSGQGKTLQWNKTQNTLTFLQDELFSTKILMFAQRYNPRGAVEYLYERQRNGDLKIEIYQPSNKTDPIVVTANYLPNTYLLGTEISAMREVFRVDQSTKLVASVEVYELKDGEYEDRGVWEYCDYDKPFDPKIFSLEGEVPDDVIRVYEYTSKDIGLEQGNLTDKEIAIKVVRVFFESLVAKHYAKVSMLLGGMPITEVKEKFSQLKVLRVISIGEPIKHEKPSGLHVPCTIEIEQDGEVIEWQPKTLLVRQVYRQPKRWRIIGGI